MMENPPSSSESRRWAGWIWLVLSLVWISLVRVPLILNARDHLDSDLAVDGLTLLDAINGHWRWHYPATPFIGTPPVLLSYLQAKVWGATPGTLASGGLVAWGLVTVATFWLNRRAFGPSVASWGLVPLAFASTGEIWLSGRITGGHLLAVAWHAGAFGILWGCLTRGGWRRALILGLWSGFGLYIDSMFAVTWAGLGVASVVSCWHGKRGQAPGPPRESSEALANSRAVSQSPFSIGRVLVCLLAFGVGAGVGVMPRVIGQRVDPHDAYVGQFSPVVRGDLVTKNGWLLALDCLPRLVAGHRLPWLQAEPDPNSLAGGWRPTPEKETGVPWLALGVTVVALGVFGRSMVALAVGPGQPASTGKRGQAPGPRQSHLDSSDSSGAGSQSPFSSTLADAVRRGIRWGLLASSLGVVAGFLVSPNITNSDNYRYLVFLVVAGSTGSGLWLSKMASQGRLKLTLAWALTLGFAALMTADSARWYARFGWVDASCLPIRREIKDPAVNWLDQNPKFTMILGDYWDVYRLAFLAGGRVSPVPFPQYPDRYPEIKRDSAGRVRAIIARPNGFGPEYRARALALGATELYRGEALSIVDWPEGMRP